MRKVKKTLLALVCAAALVVGSVAGTMAYLTDSAAVENTFTVGKVDISLDEAKVTEYGVVDGTDRVIENTYKLIPGHAYVKDPTVHVVEGSEPCYLFVKVANPLAGIEVAADSAVDSEETIAEQMNANGWILVDADNGIYAWSADGVNAGTIDARVAAVSKTVFAELNIAADANLSTVSSGAKVIVKACAVQSDGFDTVDKALAEAVFA